MDAYYSVRDATAETVRREGTRLLKDPKAFKNYMVDFIDPDSVEAKVLLTQCDERFLSYFVAGAHTGTREAMEEASARAANELSHGRAIDAEFSRSLCKSIADGVCDVLGLQACTNTKDSSGVGADEPATDVKERKGKTANGQGESFGLKEDSLVGGEESNDAKSNSSRLPVVVGAIVSAVAIIIVLLTFVGKPSAPQGSAGNTSSMQSNDLVGSTSDGGATDQKDSGASMVNDFVKVALGENHVVGLRANGTVIAAGSNGYGRLDVGEWHDIVDVAVGKDHTVGLKSDGTVVATGDNRYNQCDVLGWKDITAIAAGQELTVGLRKDGTVCVAAPEWSFEDYADISNWKGITKIAVGLRHVVGLRDDGSVVAAGDEYKNECDVSGWSNIVDVAAGYYQTIGIRADGTVVASGDNDDGACDVAGWKDIVAVDTGFAATVGVRTDGSIVLTGREDYLRAWQQATKWPAEAKDVCVGTNHLVVLCTDGRLRCAGEHFSEYGTRTKMAKWSDITAISCGGNNTIALRSNKKADIIGAHSDMKVDEWGDLKSVEAGSGYVFGVRTDGSVLATGNGASSVTLADGTYHDDSKAGDVLGWNNITAVSAGGMHTLGLKTDSTVISAGSDYKGQCKVTGWKDIVDISAGGDHSVGLKQDGTIVAVGDNDYGQCDISEWKDIVAIDAGGKHTLGLRSDGTVLAAGTNQEGECDVSDWHDITSLAAGESMFSVGLKKDGTVVACGYDEYGQCDVDSWSDIVAISAGYNHVVGLKKDGTVVGAGEGFSDICDILSARP